MVDFLSKSKRSELMGRVRGRNTSIEHIVRKALHGMGFRFRTHASGLPGHPDIVLPRHRKVVLVHGCFWHGHSACPKGTRMPTTRSAFWKAKIEGNKVRDLQVRSELRRGGWSVLEIWECQLRRPQRLLTVLGRFMAKGNVHVERKRGTSHGKLR